jgi:hypothetical protein
MMQTMTTTNKVHRVEVRTSEFEFSHGRKPRGYGNWAFEFGADDMRFYAGNYADAKAKAVKDAKAAGIDRINLGA